MSGELPDKASLRRQLRRARAALTPIQRRKAVAAFTRNVLRSGLLLRYRRIGFYASMPTELDLWPLIRAAQARGRQCFLPVVPKGRGKRMVFSRVLPGSRFYSNRYGIPEVAARRFYTARSLDLVFVPLLGFDPDGNRLGMGGGITMQRCLFSACGRFGINPCWWVPPMTAKKSSDFRRTVGIARLIGR